MFNDKELQLIGSLLAVAVKSTELQLFQNGGGALMDGVLAKLQENAEANSKTKPVKK